MEFLLQPVPRFFINQKFGENNACVRFVNGKSEVITPNKPGICPDGFQNLYSQTNGHNGLDISARRGDPILAPCDGIIEEVQTEEARGLGIGLITTQQYFCKETNKNEYMKMRFWHLKSIEINLGDTVRMGDVIGYADNTGFSSGDHLHFELKPVLQTNNHWYNILQNNGSLGAIDPFPYFKNLYISKTLKPKDNNNDVRLLQYALKLLNVFPLDVSCTGYYGDITKQAVKDFQLLYVPLSYWERLWLNGRSFGEKSLKIINTKFGFKN